MTATHHSRRDLRIEAEFLPSTLDELLDVRDRIQDFIAAGNIEHISPRSAESMADEISGWLAGKTRGVDGKAAPTRSRYRRILAALDEAPQGGPGSTSYLEQRRRREAGFATVPAVGFAGALALVLAALATGHPAAALALTPIIYVMSSNSFGDRGVPSVGHHRPRRDRLGLRIQACCNDRPGVVQEPGHGAAQVGGRRFGGEVSVGVLDGRLQAVSQVVQFVELGSADHHIVVAEAVGGGEASGEMRLLATALAAVPPRPPGGGPIGQHPPAPPAPLTHR